MSNIKLKDFSGAEIVYNGITEIEVPNATGRETTVYKELEGVGDTADIKIKNADGLSIPLQNVLTIAIPKADDSGDAIYQIEGVPTGITVTTLPTKTTYFDGETLDLTGMVVTLTYATGVTRTITDYTTIPPNGAVLHTSDTTVVVKYENAGTEVSTSFAITVDAVLQSLSIATEPTKVRYYLNETLDLTGLTVRAHYTDGTSRLVSGYTTVPANGATLTTSDTTVSVSYTESGVTKSTSFGIAVVSLQSISIASMPTKTSYNVGDRLDLTGLTVRATYSDGQGRNVTGYTTVPANGATLTANDDYVTVTYTESGITKTAGFVIEVITVQIVPWATGTDAQILAMVNALDEGKITIAETGWHVGDTRTVRLSAMSATGVGESHAAQDVQFVLMDTTLQGMTPANASKPLHFAVGLKNSLNESGYMNSSDTTTGGWDGSKRRTWCNNTFANSLPSDFKACFRQYTWSLGKGGGASSGLTQSTDLFALACEKQIFGSRTYSQADEANQFNHWQWYQTAANRKKTRSGSAYYWWESSPLSGYSNVFCFVYSDGTASYVGASDTNGVAPFGCI